MTARERLVAARAAGVVVTLKTPKTVGLHGPAEARARVKLMLAAAKAEVIAELRREQAEQQPVGLHLEIGPLSDRGKMCSVCKRVDICNDASNGYVCGWCIEWRTVGYSSFTVLADSDQPTGCRVTYTQPYTSGGLHTYGRGKADP